MSIMVATTRPNIVAANERIKGTYVQISKESVLRELSKRKLVLCSLFRKLVPSSTPRKDLNPPRTDDATARQWYTR